MTPHPMSAVAVVNADGVNVAIWHVAAEPVARTARLCGAWVTDDPEVQTRVIAARAVVVFGDDPTDRIRPLLTHAGGIIDIPATLLAIGQHISAVDEVHRASRPPKGLKRAPISWPALPSNPDWEELPAVPAGVVEEPLIRSTIAVAIWVAELADLWSSIESTRTSKPHLAEANPAPIPLPFVMGLPG